MKPKIMLFALMLLIGNYAFSQSTYQLSSHILDITHGQPAAGVKIDLSKQDGSGNWEVIDEKYTNANGRIPDFLKFEKGSSHMGIYKLTYYTQPYFEKLNQTSLYPFIDVVFEISDGNHYHVPITLSAFGYSTYRGN